MCSVPHARSPPAFSMAVGSMWGTLPASPQQPHGLRFSASGLSPLAWKAAQPVQTQPEGQGASILGTIPTSGRQELVDKRHSSLVRGHFPCACYLVPQRVHSCPCRDLLSNPPDWLSFFRSLLLLPPSIAPEATPCTSALLLENPS